MVEKILRHGVINPQGALLVAGTCNYHVPRAWQALGPDAARLDGTLPWQAFVARKDIGLLL